MPDPADTQHPDPRKAMEQLKAAMLYKAMWPAAVELTDREKEQIAEDLAWIAVTAQHPDPVREALPIPDGWRRIGCPECGYIGKFPTDRDEPVFCNHNGEGPVWLTPKMGEPPENWTPMIPVLAFADPPLGRVEREPQTDDLCARCKHQLSAHIVGAIRGYGGSCRKCECDGFQLPRVRVEQVGEDEREEADWWTPAMQRAGDEYGRLLYDASLGYGERVKRIFEAAGVSVPPDAGADAVLALGLEQIIYGAPELTQKDCAAIATQALIAPKPSLEDGER